MSLVHNASRWYEARYTFLNLDLTQSRFSNSFPFFLCLEINEGVVSVCLTCLSHELKKAGMCARVYRIYNSNSFRIMVSTNEDEEDYYLHNVGDETRTYTEYPLFNGIITTTYFFCKH